MTGGQNSLAGAEQFRMLQERHLETVLALTQANGDLLKARQRASGIEFNVMTAERQHAIATPGQADNAALEKIYVQEKAAKLELAAAENHIEKLEHRLTTITLKMSSPDTKRENPE